MSMATGDERSASLVEQLESMLDWWADVAKTDADITVPKAVEYGAMDLDIMGLSLAMLNPDAWAGADDAERMKAGREMAVLFYLQGKIGRAIGAFQQGRFPSDDTYLDIRVYSFMLSRIRETGRWVEG